MIGFDFTARVRARHRRASFIDSLIAGSPDLRRAPAEVQAMLAIARELDGNGPRMSLQTFPEVLACDIADGAQILNTTTETIICPDYTFAGNDPRLRPGAAFRHTAYFDVSNVATTPGTLTFRQRWGGVAGTAMLTGPAIALDTVARSNFSGRIEILTVWRTIGSAGTAFSMGFVILGDLPVESAANIHPYMLPQSAPAVTSSLDTTSSKALSLTAQFSVLTATTQLTNHLRILESLN